MTSRTGKGNRSLEFFRCVESIQSSTSNTPSNTHNNTLNTPNSSYTTSRSGRSEFSKAAALISTTLTNTVSKLHSLSLLAKQPSVFDDSKGNINQLIATIRQDIAITSTQINQLSLYLDTTNTNTINTNNISQATAHSNTIISSLQSKLASTTSAFKGVLKDRSATLKQDYKRREQYTSNNNTFNNNTSNNTNTNYSSMSNVNPMLNPNSSLYNPSRLYSNNNNNSNRSKSGYSKIDDTVRYKEEVDEEGRNKDSYITMNQPLLQAQLHAPTSTAYLDQRDQSIQGIEETIAELGTVYSRFAAILVEQRDMVARIDDHVTNTENHVGGAHLQLVKFFEGVGGSRAVYLKGFFILLVFFFIFILLT